MKQYEIEEKITFGKYKGTSILDLYNMDSTYLNWCIREVDGFYICLEDLKEGLLELHNELDLGEFDNNWFNFIFNEIIINKLETTLNEYYNYNFNDNYEDHYQEDYNDYERDNFDALTDGQYGDYDDFRENGGNMDHLMDGLGF
ncbi:hypothetical protein OAF16_01105 [Flavobacteriales bacterium]|nr:hypothetical protein [Flavobacteriales bacterium]